MVNVRNNGIPYGRKGISTKINLEDLIPISDYFKNIREKYEEFEGSMKGVDIQMLVNQVPGGMLNLETQLKDWKS